MVKTKEKVNNMGEYKIIRLQLPIDIDRQFSRIASLSYMKPEEYIIDFLQKYSVYPASIINYSEITEFAKYVKIENFEQEQQEHNNEHYIIREIKLPFYLYEKYKSFFNLLNETTESYILKFIFSTTHSPNQDVPLGKEFKKVIRKIGEISSKKQRDFREFDDGDTKKDELTIKNPFF